MRFSHCTALADDRGSALTACSGIAATTQPPFGAVSKTRHIVPSLAMRRTAHRSGLGRWRWVVERTFAWLSQFRRLRVRYDKRADIHEAFLSLGVRADLLAVAAQDVEDRLRPMSSFPGVHRSKRRVSAEIASMRCSGPSGGRPLDISKH